ncbi:MAG: hypothetical protein WDW38_010327 [Sanguina aurantia]
MNIFQKRLSRPNQLATLRELEGRVNIGKVQWVQDNLAILSGVNSDAPLGTKLSFLSGATGVLLWHRSDNLAFALVLGGAQRISVGEAAECRLKGVLQVVDDSQGPVTRKDYELVLAPAGDDLFGRVVDFLGRPVDIPGHQETQQAASTSSAATTAATAATTEAADSGKASGGSSSSAVAVAEGGDDVIPGLASARRALGVERTRPLLNTQVAMKDRDQINESLFTGVKALDILTPLGRGASLLVIGPHSSGLSSLALDAILAQRSSGVKCVVAMTSATAQQLQQVVSDLKAAGSLHHTSVVVAMEGAPLGEQYAALCLACSIGERIRDEGGHSLVVLDDMRPLAKVWETLLAGLAGLGSSALRQGLIKTEVGKDAELAAFVRSEEELVEYEGMLVSGAVAQRRGFFSTLFMRAAKMGPINHYGSMSMLTLVPGSPATGISKRVDMSRYQTLSQEQMTKVEAVLRQRLQEEMQRESGAGELSTESVEEFISIADGQLVLQPRADLAGPYVINPRLSITRIGTRAYPRAMDSLAPRVRFELAQAEDARKFALDAQQLITAQRAEAMSQRLSTALMQVPGSPVPLEEQVALLFAIQKGYLDAVPVGSMPHGMQQVVTHLRSNANAALEDIAKSKMLTAAAEQAVESALKRFAYKTPV